MKYYLPVILFLLMLIDGHVTRVVSDWSQNIYMANAHLLILALLCCSRSFPRKYLVITATVLGIIFDTYYIGVIGIYAVALPVSVLLMKGLSSVIYKSFYTEFLSMIIFVTSFELFTLIIQIVFKLSTVDATFFISRFLGPTLLLNMVLFILFIFPFKKLFVYE